MDKARIDQVSQNPNVWAGSVYGVDVGYIFQRETGVWDVEVNGNIIVDDAPDFQIAHDTLMRILRGMK